MIRAILRLLLAVTLATSATLVAPVAKSLAATCSGVWVVIDYGALGGTSTRCATGFSSGSTALSS
ncbi:MAG: hypothetical protein IPL43_11550, partial [Micropruina sp.]|nr:hypothetical protein [Micropruina sp.]